MTTEKLQQTIDFIVQCQAESASRQSRIEEKLEALAAQDVAMAKYDGVLMEHIAGVNRGLGVVGGNLQRLADDLEKLTGNVQNLTQDVKSLTGNLQTLTKDVQRLTEDVQQIAEERRALSQDVDTLARVGEGLIQVTRIHGRRLDRIENEKP